MIITSYDPDTDTLYVRFAPPGAQSARTAAATPQITLDFDQDERLIALEVLNVRQRLHPAADAQSSDHAPDVVAARLRQDSEKELCSKSWRMMPETVASH